MAREPYKYSFATERLKDNNFKIFNNGEQILKYKLPDYPHWKISKIETKVKIGTLLFKGDISRTNMISDYSSLLHYGVMVSKRQPRIMQFKGQRVEYFLTRNSTVQKNIGYFPQNHFVKVNPQTRQFRLVGKSASGEWYNPFPHRRLHEYHEAKSLFDNTQFNYRDTMKDYLNIKEEVKYSKPIKEIVLGISVDGRLICIQEERENPTIGMIGKKRNGKSLMKHRFNDNLYHKWNKKVAELNDVLLETDSYSQTWEPITRFSNLDLINEVSLPLPMVYLHPNTRTLTNLIAPDETGFRIYIAFIDFIKDYNNILKGRDDLKLQKSGVYFRNLLYDKNGDLDKDGLAFCKSYAEIEEVVLKKMINKKEDSEMDKQTKIPEGVIPKILGVMKDMDNTKILDVSNGETAKWKIEFPDGHTEEHYPWTCCLIADLVPSIITDNVKNSHPELHPQWSNFILKDLFKNQTENEWFKKNNIELFLSFDEILSLVDSPVAVDTFKMVIRESGHKRIGFTYCTQSWNDIPKFIQSQTDYVISFKQEADWAKEICKNFGVVKHKADEMVSLRKGEFIIFSSNPIILYDEHGHRESVDDEAIKGTIFPSLSAHKAPKSVGA